MTRTAVVVPGHHGPERLADLVRAAERIAGETSVGVVVFTGWARRGGMTEAEQMHEGWRGPDVELVLEATASSTAENAARTLPLLLERSVKRALVVCAPLHRYRTRFFFTRLYGAYGIEVELRVARTRRSVGALLWEVGAATACRRQLRAAKAELAQVVGS
ncbi:MAG: YdcF family protein [Gaiellaceae bacterium]